MPTHKTDIYHLKKFLINYVSPNANIMDIDSSRLKQALFGLRKISDFAPHIPKKYGGLGYPNSDVYKLQETVSRYSGALAFLLFQHIRAIDAILSSENEELKVRYLPKVAQGKLLLGACRSHLGRREKIYLKGKSVGEDYRVSGDMIYVTGLGMLDKLFMGFVLPNKKEVSAIIPFENIDKFGGMIKFSDPMKVMVMFSANSVSVKLRNWLVKKEDVLSAEQSGSYLKKNFSTASLTAFPVGTAQAALDIISRSEKIKSFSFVRKHYNFLNKNLKSLRSKLINGNFGDPTLMRVKIMGLMMGCVQTAMMITGGKSALLDNDAQRLYREAALWTIPGINPKIIDAYFTFLKNKGY